MKNRTFIATIAVAIIAGVSIFVACKIVKTTNTIFKSADASDNPYDFMGQWHNEALTGLYNQYNTLFVSDSAAYAYLNQFIMSKFSNITLSDLPTFDESQSGTAILMDETYYMLIGEQPMSQYLSDPVLKYATDSLTHILTYMAIRDNYLLTPDDFSSKIFKLEDTILSLNMHSTPTVADGNDMILNDYDRILSCLAVARYSYSFWYNIATNEEHFLHDDFLSVIEYDYDFDPDAKSDDPEPGSLFKRIGNFFRRAADAVSDFVSGVATVVSSDFRGAFVKTNNTNNNRFLNPDIIPNTDATVVKAGCGFSIYTSIKTAGGH